VRDFEREARTDGIPADELLARKRALVLELNRRIAAKKARAAAEDARNELLGGGAKGMPAAAAAQDATTTTIAPPPPQHPTMQALMHDGRKKMAETDAALLRAEKVVEETRMVGQQVAATLSEQTKQLNGIADGLSEIEFTMKKAGKVLRDIARGVATDRCVAFLLLLVAGGVVALVVVKVVKPNRAALAATARAARDSVPQAWVDAAGNGTAALAGRIGEVAAGAATSAGAAISGAAGAALAGAGIGGGGGGAAAADEATIPDVVTPAPERRRRRLLRRRRRLAEQLFYGG
jgi:SNARE protein